MISHPQYHYQIRECFLLYLLLGNYWVEQEHLPFFWETAGILWSSLWRWILRLMLFKEGRATAIASLKFRNSAHKISWEVSFVFPALFLIRALIFVASTLVCDGVWVCLFSLFRKVSSVESFPNGQIFDDSPSIRGRNSTWKVRGNYIDFERQIHVEVMTSIRRVHFDLDSTFKIDEMSMSSPREFFFIVSTLNRCNFCTRCFHSIIS